MVMKQVAYSEAADGSPMDRQPQLTLSLHTHTHTQDTWFTSGYFPCSTPGYSPIPLESFYPFGERIIVVTDIRTGLFVSYY
jgi:hypothetical protein